jgi:large subunit ribosomal protein L34e
MVRPSLRSGKRKLVKTPKKRYHYVSLRKKPKRATCGQCGAILHGVARGTRIEVKKLTHSERRPTRKYAGVLCNRCLSRMVIERARQLA